MFTRSDNPLIRELPPIDVRRRQLLCATGSLAFVGVGTLGAANPAAAQTISISTAINRAGYIRALSQQIAKAYAQVALDVLPEKGADIIVASQALIQRNIQQLQLVQNAPESAKYLDKLNTDSNLLLAAVNKTATKENALTISVQADSLLVSADRATNFYQGLSKSSQAKIVNIAGRQRMLSQRAAKCYFLMQAGHDTKETRAELAKARLEFKDAMDVMVAMPIAAPQIKAELDLAKQQWAALETSMDQKPNAVMMRNVATTSERVLSLMDSLTNQYDQVLRDLLGFVGNSDMQLADGSAF